MTSMEGAPAQGGAVPAVDETYVVIEFEDNAVTLEYLAEGKTYAISVGGLAAVKKDLDTPKPVLVIGNDLYEGRYEDFVGSEIVFSERPREGFHIHKVHDYFCHTSKRIIFKWVKVFPPVSLFARDDAPSQATDGPSQPLEVSQPLEASQSLEAVDEGGPSSAFAPMEF